PALSPQSLAFVVAQLLRTGCADRHTGERPVHVHRTIQFAIGIAPEHTMGPVQFRHVAVASILDAHTSLNRLEPDIERYLPDFFLDLREEITGWVDRVTQCGHREHEAFVDGGGKMQRAVRIDPAYRAYVIRIADPYEHRMGCKRSHIEYATGDAGHARVL